MARIIALIPLAAVLALVLYGFWLIALAIDLHRMLPHGALW